MNHRPPQPAAPGPDPGEDPGPRARVEIRLRPAELRAGGTVSASDAPMLVSTLAMTTTGALAMISAVFTADIAARGALGWYLGLAGAELVFALVVIVLIARRDHSGQHRQDTAAPGPGRTRLPSPHGGPVGPP
jgi:hypothetical protein